MVLNCTDAPHVTETVPNPIYKQPCTHILFHVCENMQRIHIPKKNRLKDICIHHSAELLQNAPNKTWINPALRNTEIKRILDQRYYMRDGNTTQN